MRPCNLLWLCLILSSLHSTSCTLECPANMHTAAGGISYESGAVATTLSGFPQSHINYLHLQLRFNPSCDKIAYIAKDGKNYVVNYPAMTNALIGKTYMDAQTQYSLVWANDNVFYYNRGQYMRAGIIQPAERTSSWYRSIMGSQLNGNPGQVRGMSLSNDKTTLIRTYGCSLYKISLTSDWLAMVDSGFAGNQNDPCYYGTGNSYCHNTYALIAGHATACGNVDGGTGTSRFDFGEGQTINGDYGGYGHTIFNSDDTGIYIADWLNNKIRYLDLSTNIVSSNCAACVTTYRPMSLAITPDGQYLLVGRGEGTASKVLSVNTVTGVTSEDVISNSVIPNLNGGTHSIDICQSDPSLGIFLDHSTTALTYDWMPEGPNRQVRTIEFQLSVDTCIDCPEETPFSPAGSTSVDACYNGCDPGQAFNAEIVCEQCEAGTYQDESGYTGACKACPANTVSPAGSTDATACICDVGYGHTGSECAACTTERTGSTKPVQATTPVLSVPCLPSALTGSTATAPRATCTTQGPVRLVRRARTRRPPTTPRSALPVVRARTPTARVAIRERSVSACRGTGLSLRAASLVTLAPTSTLLTMSRALLAHWGAQRSRRARCPRRRVKRRRGILRT